MESLQNVTCLPSGTPWECLGVPLGHDKLTTVYLVYSTYSRLPFLSISYSEMASPFSIDWGAWVLPWGLLPLTRHRLVLWVNRVVRRRALKNEPQCFSVLEGTLVKYKAGTTHSSVSCCVCGYFTLNVVCVCSSVLPIITSTLHRDGFTTPICHGNYTVLFIISCGGVTYTL